LLPQRLARAYAAGLVAALAASPCATPVLASILAWVSATRDPAAGGLLLLSYSVGYVAPLLVAGAVAELGAGGAALASSPTTIAGSNDSLGALRSAVRSALASGGPQLISRASGCLLVAGGVYAVLSRVVPDK
jgi:cytochrome c-type biogenesis protein